MFSEGGLTVLSNVKWLNNGFNIPNWQFYLVLDRYNRMITDNIGIFPIIFALMCKVKQLNLGGRGYKYPGKFT
jgi:hypothetical protein